MNRQARRILIVFLNEKGAFSNPPQMIKFDISSSILRIGLYFKLLIQLYFAYYSPLKSITENCYVT